MKLLFTIIGGLLLLTYSWGWLINVSDGPMTTSRYTRYYLREVREQIGYFLEEASNFAKKPLPRPKTFREL